MTARNRPEWFVFVVMPWMLCSLCYVKALPSEYDNSSHIVVLESGNAERRRESAFMAIPEDLENLFDKVIYWSDVGNNRTQCQTSLISLAFDLADGKPYAKRVLDATGKLGSGVLEGNTRWLGRYHECLTINVDDFQGKWCSISLSNVNRAPPVIVETLAVGICLPNTCTEVDLDNFVSDISNGTTTAGWIANCPEQPRQWNASDVIFVMLFSAFVIFLIAGTAVDIYVHNLKRKRDEILLEEDVEVLTGVTSPALNESAGWIRPLLSFSIIKNTKSLLKVERKHDVISCVHGLRFISMTWVVLGHSYYFLVWKVDNLADMYHDMIRHISILTVTNSVLAVDTFFFISGLLVAYLALKDGNRLTWKRVPSLYLQRYLRLTPPYAFVILFSLGIFGKLGNGPLWEDSSLSRQSPCEKFWWTNLLYINNLYPTIMYKQCFGLGWYLANDMQFFLLSPISLLILKRNRNLGLALILFGIFSGMLVTGVISSHYNSQPVPIRPSIGMKDAINATNSHRPISKENEFWNDTYERPWCRISVYLIGMLTGYVLATTKCSIKMSKIIVVFGWAIAAILNLIVLYGVWWYVQHSVPMEPNLTGLYNAMSKPMWACGLAWVVIACATGNGGPVNTFLSWKAFVPVSRLTYCTYLVQVFIIYFWLGTIEEYFHFTVMQMPISFLGLLSLSIGCAYALSMLVEMPLVNLTKVVTEKFSTSSSSD